MKQLIICILLTISVPTFAQQGTWLAKLHRSDGNTIPFTFDWKIENSKMVWYIHNAAEKIKVTNIVAKGDSLWIQMPVFESQFKLQYHNNKLTGVWLKNGASKIQSIPFTAEQGIKRFASNTTSHTNITGRWATTFAKSNPKDLSIAELKQLGNKLSGTFLNATGDLRYLEGIVTKDSLFLSCFDGSHAFLFTAKVDDDKKISGGTYYSGATYSENWFAIKDENAKIATESVAMFVKPGEEKLNFTFKNLTGKIVSINDNSFKNKVVVIQLMGSWCPNCMDETAYLTEYYTKNKQRGIAIIALAYEYTTNWERSIKSLQKFQQRFNIAYPILNTEVAVTDTLRTEKTLPQLTAIKVFPSSIILDKKGRIRKLDTNFNGPATGEHYEFYKKEFEATIDTLLQEK